MIRRSLAVAILALLLASPAHADLRGAGLPPNGDGSLVNVKATGGSALRTLQDHFRDLSSLFDYGAVCDGSTDATAAVSSFNTAGGGLVPRPLSLPATTNYCKTTTARTLFSGPYWSFSGGRIADTNGNLLGPIFGAVTAPPTQLGTYNSGSETTAFNADFSKSLLAMDFNITGATTLGQPSSGYTFTRNAYPVYGYLYNSSGFNNGTAGNGNGRTGAAATFWDIYNAGQGDMTAFICNGFVSSTKPGATSFLANPEVACMAGQLIGGADGTYLEAIGDINLIDQGHDIAAFSWVNNYNRTNSTGALNVNWVGMRQQSIGTKPLDAVASFIGPTGISLDLTGQTYPDKLLVGISLTAAGTAYAANDVLTVAGGTADTATVIKVLTVDGSGVILTFAVERAGKYTVAPASPNTVTGGAGSGATFTVQYSGANGLPAIVMPANAAIYGNATNDTGAYSTKYPSTAKLGTSWISWDSSISAWNFVSQNNSVFQLYNNKMLVNQTLVGTTSLMVGSAVALTMVTGEVGLAKITASGSAPGAAGLKMEAVCGTNAGTLKIIAYGGTSTTPVTVTDNIGSGATGC